MDPRLKRILLAGARLLLRHPYYGCLRVREHRAPFWGRQSSGRGIWRSGSAAHGSIGGATHVEGEYNRTSLVVLVVRAVAIVDVFVVNYATSYTIRMDRRLR